VTESGQIIAEGDDQRGRETLIRRGNPRVLPSHPL